MENNLISINIVAYNAERTVGKTLSSVANQQNVSMELIFVDDCSTDSTLNIVKEFQQTYPRIPCTIISNPSNLGITKSHNIALEHSKGNFIAILDSDDVWSSPQKLKKQLGFLLAHPEYAAVGSQMNILNTEGTILKTTQFKTDDTAIRNKMLILNQIAHSTVLMRNQNLKYDDSIYIWEDYELFLRLGINHKLANIDEVLTEYLYQPKKLTLKQKLKRASTEIEIIEKYRKNYPNFWIGYGKGIVKYVLILLHIK